MTFNNGAPPVPTQPKETKPNNQPKAAQPTHTNGMSPPMARSNRAPQASNYYYVPKEYFELAQSMFPDAPFSNIQRYLPEVLQALMRYHLGDQTMVLMALATIRVETGKFAPVTEYISKYNTSPNGEPYNLYDFRSDLGNKVLGDGARYCGRGFIQLTGKANYQQYSIALGLGNLLVNEPEQANEPSIAAMLLACFLKNHEDTIRKALAQGDFTTARKAVNGGKHGLDQFIACYQTGENWISSIG